jgi:hypothetical protein
MPGEARLGANTEDLSGHCPRRSLRRFEIAPIVILLAVWLPGLVPLAEVWRTVEYSSHRFLVPVVALWAAIAHRVEWAELEPKPIRDGFLLLGVVAVLYLFTLAFRHPALLGLITVTAVCATTLALRRVAAVIPIALPRNLLRVVLTVIASIYVSVEFATVGRLHEWADVATYVVGCLCLLGVGALMQRFVGEEEPGLSAG